MRTLGFLVALSMSIVALAVPAASAECVGDRTLHVCAADMNGDGVPNVVAAGANTPAGGAHANAIGRGTMGSASACGGAMGVGGGCAGASGAYRDLNGDGVPDVGHGGVHMGGGAMGHRGGAGANVGLIDVDHDGSADVLVLGAGTSETGGQRIPVVLP